MNRFMSFLMLVFALLASTAFAAEPAKTETQVKLELLKSLEKDGYLSNKLATEAKLKYIDASKVSAPVTTSSAKAEEEGVMTMLSRYLSIAVIVKVVGVGLLLLAFGGTIRNIIAGVWHLLVKVPVEVYQVPMLAGSVYATVMAASIWPSQAFYVALLASIANLILLGWVLATHVKLVHFLAKLFNLGIPVSSVISFWLMLYFGVLAIHYQSQLFGFFAAVALSGVFTFGLYYSWGTLYLHFQKSALPAVVFGHLLVLIGYAILHAMNQLPEQAQYFAGGIEYYCSVALGVGLLVGASPWNRDNAGLYVVIFLATIVAALVGYTMFDLTVIGSFIMCFALLFVLEWLMYLGYKSGVVVGSAIVGASLYGASLLMEQYSHLIVLTLA